MFKKIIIGAGMFSLTALAQPTTTDVDATADVEMKTDDSIAPGWKSSANVTAGGNVIENENVIGQKDGQTTIYNLKLNMEAAHHKENSQWVSTLSIDETVSRTPSLDKFVKTGDSFDAATIYKHFLPSVSWLGAYGRLSVKTSLFDSFDYQSEEVTYAIGESDGTARTVVDDQFKISQSFKPLTTKESAGAIAQMINTVPVTAEVRTGLGAKQVQADGQYIIDDNADTVGVIEAYELRNTTVVGWEVVAEAKGAFLDGMFGYKLYGEALYPFSYTPKGDDDPAAAQLIATEAIANVHYNLNQWFSLNYDFKSVKDPLLLPEAQVTHSFLLAASYTTAIR